ncbi:hypothetical protein R1flu_023003 [Riccia fluitans]|uniref:Aminotransferase-like plant mobile domain-containing protein n=1 Tax=Riccia fluitans TaxID=41844 RepID=A0ABD1XTR9_9MARC
MADENTDAEGDRLLVKDARGGTNIIGWNEISVVFGAKHNDSEDFRSIKVMHTTLDKYNPRAYLPASVEHNPNKKLVSGQPYEEVLYYKDAAPYGPTCCLMTTVAELFWSAGRSNRFLTPMILAYLHGLHGHGYNWAKAILHGLRNEIHFLQSRARNNEGGKPIPVVWAPCLVHILFGLRRNLFVGTPLEEAEGWVGWTHVTKDTDMTLPQLHSKFPKLITSLSHLRQRCQLPEEIPIASPEQAVSTKRPRAKDKQPEEFVLPSIDGEAIREGIECCNPTGHISVTAKEKAAEETHLQKLALVQTQLEETKQSSEASIKRLEEEAFCLREALAAKESAMQALENAHQKEISTLKATCRKYKTSLDGEIGINADLQARVLNL